MLKIGMLLDNQFSGDLRVENEVESLVAAGYAVTVLCFNYGDKAEREEYRGGLILRRPINKKLLGKLKGLTNTFLDPYTRLWARMTVDFVREQAIDVLHVHDLNLLPAALKARRKLPGRIPIVADLHENYPAALSVYRFANVFPGKFVVSIPRWRAGERRWLAEADEVITVIEEALERYARIGVPADKLTVVANYVNRSEFTDAAPRDQTLEGRFAGKFVLSYLGGFDVHRGLEETLRAVAIARRDIAEIQLVLVGTGRNFDDLQALAAELDLDEAVSFEGWRSPNELPAYLAVSDVCLIPHVKSEHTDHTIPHKLFQYMYLEKPVIASDCAPLARILADTGAGLTYPSGDEQALADRILALYRDEEMRSAMGRRGKASVDERYNWAATARNLTELYDRLAVKWASRPA